MPQLTPAVKGTADFLPEDIYKLQYVEQTAIETAKNFGFCEMRTPVFEYTELFSRGVGDTTDVVQKEMYTFDDKGGRSLSLRPEGTAGVVRAFLEHGLYNEPLPQKICYLTSCYRYEKPQSGRQREFHQFGAEVFGPSSPTADAEVIGLAAAFFDALGITDLGLEINSIGCPICRKNYLSELRAYFEAHRGDLCPTCLSRLERNPMRILDCKSPVCAQIAENAPVVLDFLCADCQAHFLKLKEYLSVMELDFTVNPKIVRGLDYYTRTVFEFVSQNDKIKGLVCGGGGRYDGLVEELGGAPLPACGFGLGLERTLLAMEASDAPFPPKARPDLVFVTTGAQALTKAVEIADSLRRSGYMVLFDEMERSVKAQMKFAGKTGALYTAVIGDDELIAGKVILKNMRNPGQTELLLNSFEDGFERAILSECTDDILAAEDYAE